MKAAIEKSLVPAVSANLCEFSTSFEIVSRVMKRHLEANLAENIGRMITAVWGGQQEVLLSEKEENNKETEQKGSLLHTRLNQLGGSIRMNFLNLAGKRFYQRRHLGVGEVEKGSCQRRTNKPPLSA